MKAKIIMVIPVFIFTLFSFITFLNVLNGSIGNKENWRIILSLIGFIILLLGTVFSNYIIITRK